MKKINKRLITTTLIILTLFGFYKINILNYSKHIEIKKSYVEHPENLPTKEAALISSFGYKNLKADIYWLKSIQYIGGNAIGSEYKKYLFFMMDLVTELNPYFAHPYIIGELLLPNYNERYEKISKEEQARHIEESIKIGLKGIKNFCNLDKIKLVQDEDNLQKLWTDEKYKNACSDYNIPSYLAYIYYYYKNDPTTAAKYYKVSSTVEGGMPGLKIMSAIMSGKGGNREKSYFMFLNIAKFIESDNEICLDFAGKLEQVGGAIFINKNIALDGKILKNIDDSRTKIFGKFTEDKEEKVLSDTKCENYVNKAIRELNLEYIERGNKKFMAEKGTFSVSAKELYEKKYIDYLPIDFQQYKDYGIIYYYNTDTKNYDYKMGSYNELQY